MMHTWSSGPQQQNKQTILEVFITHLGRRCFFSLKLLLLHLRQSLWCCICPLFDKPCLKVVSTLHLLASTMFTYSLPRSSSCSSPRQPRPLIFLPEIVIEASDQAPGQAKSGNIQKFIFLGWNPDLGGQRQFFYSFCPGFDWVWWVIFAHLHKVGGEDSNLRRSVKNSSRKRDLQTGEMILAQQALTLPPSLPFHHPSSTSHMKSKFWSTLKWLM